MFDKIQGGRLEHNSLKLNNGMSLILSKEQEHPYLYLIRSKSLNSPTFMANELPDIINGIQYISDLNLGYVKNDIHLNIDGEYLPTSIKTPNNSLKTAILEFSLFHNHNGLYVYWNEHVFSIYDWNWNICNKIMLCDLKSFQYALKFIHRVSGNSLCS